MAHTGRFITLEGLEGVGKTTNRDYVQSILSSQGIDALVTREPGGTKLAEQLRHLLLHADAPVCAEAEFLMMAAARKQHTVDVISPALQAGRWVLCDRYVDASYAYQGGGRELGANVVSGVHELLNIDIKPDLTFLLDMPIADGLKRMAQRGKPDRIEQEKLSFFERARAAYLQRANDDPDRVKVLDASLSLPEVQKQVHTHLTAFLQTHHG